MLSDKTTLQILQGVNATLSNPRAWGKGQSAGMAKDEKNKITQYAAPHATGATCWCITGAAYKALPLLTFLHGPSSRLTAAIDYLDMAALQLFPSRCEAQPCPVVQFNDHPHTTHDDVLSVIQRAIELATEKEQSNG